MDKYAFFFDNPNAKDAKARARAEQELRQRARDQQAEEAEQRKIQEAQDQRVHQHRPRPAPGRKPISPRTSAERKAELARSAIRKTPPPRSPPWSKLSKQEREAYESFQRAKAQRLPEATSPTKAIKDDPAALELYESFMTPPNRRGPGFNGRARYNPLDPSRPNPGSNGGRARISPTPQASRGQAYRRVPAPAGAATRSFRPSAPPAQVYKRTRVIEEFSDDTEAESEDMPPPISARSPLHRNAPREDTTALSRRPSIFNQNARPIKKSTGAELPGLFGAKSPLRATTSTGNDLFSSGGPPPTRDYRSQVQQGYVSDSDTSSGFASETLEAMTWGKRDITTRRPRPSGGRARFDQSRGLSRPLPSPEFPGDRLHRFDDNRLLDSVAVRNGIRRTGGIRRSNPNSGALGPAGQPTTLARTDRVQKRQGGTHGVAGVSGLQRTDRVPARQGGTQGIAGVSGVQRTDRVDPRQGGTQGIAGVSGIHRVPRVTPNRPKKQTPEESQAKWLADFADEAFYGSRYDEEGHRRSTRTQSWEPESEDESPRKKSKGKKASKK